MSTFSDKHGADKGGPEKDLPDEQQLDEYLRGGSSVSQQYHQLRSADVPTELDRLVLRQAQEAVKARPAKSRVWMRWAGPLALAASTVLVVSIVIESGVHEEAYLPVPASAPADLPAKQEAPQANQAQEKAAAGNAADSSVVHVVPFESEQVYDAPAFTVPEAPAPAPAPAPAASEDERLALQPAAPPPAAAPADQPPAELARREKVQVTAARARANTAAESPAPAALSAQAREQDTRLEEVIMTAQKRRQQPKQGAGPRNTVAAPAAADASDAADERQEEQRNYSDPEQWLRDIRQLRKEDKHDAADREWRRFREVFPNYEVADTDLARESQ